MNETPAPDPAPDGTPPAAPDDASGGTSAGTSPGGTTGQYGTGQYGAGQYGTGQYGTGQYGQDDAGQPGYPPAPAPSGMDGFFASIRRTGLFRTEERWIGGVAGGVAARLGIDPLIVRGLFGIGVLLGGIGLVLYGIGWLLMPEQRDGRIHLQQLFRGDFDAAVIGGFAVLLIGFAFSDNWRWLGWGNGNGWWGGLVGLVVIGMVIALIVSSSTRGRQGAPTGPGGPVGAGFAPPPPAGSAGPTTTLRPGGPHYPASVPPAAARRPEGTTMYPAPPAPGVPHAAPPQGGAPWPTQPIQPPQAYRPMPPVPPMTAMRPVPPGLPVTSLAHTKPRGPGSQAVGIVVALGLIILAGLLYAEREGAYDGPVLLTTAAAVVILCGLGIAVAGAMGRTSGGLGAIAIITILVVTPATAAADFSFEPDGAFAGDGRFTPRTVAAAEEGYSWMVGDVTIDLTELPPGTAMDIPLEMGAGDVHVLVPEDGAYTARVRVGAGDMDWLGETVVSGVGNGWQTFESAAVEDGAEPTMQLTINIGAGKLTVDER